MRQLPVREPPKRRRSTYYFTLQILGNLYMSSSSWMRHILLRDGFLTYSLNSCYSSIPSAQRRQRPNEKTITTSPASTWPNKTIEATTRDIRGRPVSYLIIQSSTGSLPFSRVMRYCTEYGNPIHQNPLIGLVIRQTNNSSTGVACALDGEDHHFVPSLPTRCIAVHHSLYSFSPVILFLYFT